MVYSSREYRRKRAGDNTIEEDDSDSDNDDDSGGSVLLMFSRGHIWIERLRAIDYTRIILYIMYIILLASRPN
jgi:hypothetical protein